MDQETKKIFGNLLGQNYRILRRLDPNFQIDDGRLFGLLYGFEHVIDEELERGGWVSEVQVNAVHDVLAPYWDDEEELKKLTGFYDIERQLQARGVDRGTAIKIFDLFAAEGKYPQILEKMNSNNSPIEAKTFGIKDRI